MAYVVRMRDGQKYNGPRLVGVWEAENNGRLWHLADQVGDPEQMECAKLRAGGIMLAPPDFEAELDEYVRFSAWQPLTVPEIYRE